jgi:hypothetical protein
MIVIANRSANKAIYSSSSYVVLSTKTKGQAWKPSKTVLFRKTGKLGAKLF